MPIRQFDMTGMTNAQKIDHMERVIGISTEGMEDYPAACLQFYRFDGGIYYLRPVEGQLFSTCIEGMTLSAREAFYAGLPLLPSAVVATTYTP